MVATTFQPESNFQAWQFRCHRNGAEIHQIIFLKQFLPGCAHIKGSLPSPFAVKMGPRPSPCPCLQRGKPQAGIQTWPQVQKQCSLDTLESPSTQPDGTRLRQLESSVPQTCVLVTGPCHWSLVFQLHICFHSLFPLHREGKFSVLLFLECNLLVSVHFILAKKHCHVFFLCF